MAIKRLQALALTLCLMAAAATAWGDVLPGYYPDEFPRTGHVDRVDIRDGDIVINDTLFILSGNTPVHTLHTRFGTISDLRQGMTVGFAFSAGPAGKRQVTEMWILPADFNSFSE